MTDENSQESVVPQEISEATAPSELPEPLIQSITLNVNLNLLINGSDLNINSCLPELAKCVRLLKHLEGVEATSIILTVTNKEAQAQNKYQMLVGNKKRANGDEDFHVMALG